MTTYGFRFYSVIFFCSAPPPHLPLSGWKCISRLTNKRPIQLLFFGRSGSANFDSAPQMLNMSCWLTVAYVTVAGASTIEAPIYWNTTKHTWLVFCCWDSVRMTAANILCQIEEDERARQSERGGEKGVVGNDYIVLRYIRYIRDGKAVLILNDPIIQIQISIKFKLGCAR